MAVPGVPAARVARAATEARTLAVTGSREVPGVQAERLDPAVRRAPVQAVEALRVTREQVVPVVPAATGVTAPTTSKPRRRVRQELWAVTAVPAARAEPEGPGYQGA